MSSLVTLARRARVERGTSDATWSVASLARALRAWSGVASEREGDACAAGGDGRASAAEILARARRVRRARARESDGDGVRERSFDGRERAMVRGDGFAYDGERVSARTSSALNEEITSASTVDEILEHVLTRSHLYNRVNCATAWHRLGKTYRATGRAARWREDERMGELEATTRRLLPSLAVQNLSNIAWACAVLKYRPNEDLLGSIADRSEQLVSEFYPQALTNILWAYTVLKHPRTRKLAEILAPAILDHLPSPDEDLQRAELAPGGMFSTQTVSNTLWTYASMGVHPGAELLDRLSAFIIKGAGNFKAQELSNSCWAYAQFGHHPGDETLRTFERSLLERREEYTTQALANTSIALAFFGGSENGGLRELFNKVPPSFYRLGEGNSQDISNIVWSIASVGAFESKVYKAAVRELFRRDLSDFQPEGLKMLFHSRMLQHDFDPDRTVVDVVYPDWVAEKGREPWLQQTVDTRVSTFQQQVLEAVKSAGYEPTMEQLTEDGLMSMDICLLDSKIAIECDGPSHYYTNFTERLTEKTRLRDKQLEVRGWKVVTVPYFEWAVCYSAGDLETKAYVHGKVRAVLGE